MKYLLMIIVVIIANKLFSLLIKRYWLKKNNLLPLLSMSQTGKTFVPWEDVLTPQNSKVVKINAIIDYLNKTYKSIDFILDNHLSEINNLLNNESLRVIEFRSPAYTWRNKCGTAGYLFFDSSRKEQLMYFKIAGN